MCGNIIDNYSIWLNRVASFEEMEYHTFLSQTVTKKSRNHNTTAATSVSHTVLVQSALAGPNVWTPCCSNKCTSC